MNITEIETEVAKIIEADSLQNFADAKESIRVGALMIVGLSVVHGVKELVEATGYDELFVAGVRRRFIAGAIWRPGDTTTYAEWTKATESDGIAFNLDVQVGLGLLERSLNDEGDYVYKMTAAGDEHVRSLLKANTR